MQQPGRCIVDLALCRLFADVVVVVGYGTSGNTPFFLAKNSWGTSWGEQVRHCAWVVSRMQRGDDIMSSSAVASAKACLHHSLAAQQPHQQMQSMPYLNLN
jgi:hypothetical protein